MISFNASATNAKIIANVSLAELISAIQNYESVRIGAYWSETILSTAEDGTWLNGFQFSTENPVYFSVALLKQALNSTLSGLALTKKARALPIDVQRNILIGLQPSSRDCLFSEGYRCKKPLLAPDFVGMAKEAGSIEKFVDILVSQLNQNTCLPYHASRYIELLTALWDCGWILFPHTVVSWITNQKWTLIANPLYAKRKSKIVALGDAFREKNYKDSASMYVSTFFAVTSVEDGSDLSLEIVSAYKPFAEFDARRRSKTHERAIDALGRVQAATNSILLLYNSANPTDAVGIMRRPRAGPKPETRRVDGKFRWLTTKNPTLTEWADGFCDYVAQLKTSTVSGQIDSLNYFGDFLCSLDNAPLPFEVRRQVHVYDATRTHQQTFSEYLRKLKIKHKRRQAAFTRLRQFFDWYIDSVPIEDHRGRAFSNPFLSTDTFSGGRGTPGKTSRDALPSFILNEMKAVITENDFAFSRKYTTPVTVFDKVSGAMVNTWFPAVPICLFLMLEAPIRSHQARWLDSGLLDELRYDVARAKEKLNDSPVAIRGRREGVLRLQGDLILSDKWLSLWINTNKSAVYDSDDVGYSIPYVSEQATALISIMIEWQQRYMPRLEAPIPYFNFEGHLGERGRLKGTGPQVAPLFRDPTTKSNNEPVSRARLGTFYTAVLEETQHRIRLKYGKDVKLVNVLPNGKTKWAVDLHTLRVSGITAMIESGVPLEVVSQFVAGHATLVMTLHYLKYSPKKLRQFLFEAHERMRNDTGFLESDLFSANLDVFRPFLLGQDGQGIGPGFDFLKEQSGLLSINAEGICPGTSCSTGGPALKGGFGPVPGGQRCGLCRYWLTGPAHLLGQVASVNNLAYVIRKKGLQVAELQDKKIDAEDAGDSRTARRLRDRIEILNRELAIDLEEWTARYNYASRSVELLDEYLASKASVEGSAAALPVLTRSSSMELKVTLEQSHEFALLDQITQMSAFVTGFENREAGLEKNSVLSKMMTANGINPFLLSLSDRQAHEAGNLLSALVLQQVRAQELDAVLSGQTLLSDFPTLDRTVRALGEHVKEIKLGGAPRLQEIVEAARKSDENLPADDEEKFG